MRGIMLKHLGHNFYIFKRALSLVREDQAAGTTARSHVQAFLKEYDVYDLVLVGPQCTSSRQGF